MGPISPTWKHIGKRYIITATDYLTRWAKVVLVKDYNFVIAANFLFENVVTRLRWPKFLISNQGTHFVNQLIEELMDKFHIYHRNKTP